MYRVKCCTDPNATFDDLFELEYRRMISYGSFMLSYEVCHIAPDRPFIILAAVSASNHRPHRNVEAPSSHLNGYSLGNETESLDDYCFYLVNLETGSIEDTLVFDKDTLILSSSLSGVTFDRSSMCIVSLQHQIISIYTMDYAKRKFAFQHRYGCTSSSFPGTFYTNPGVTDLKAKLITALYEEGTLRHALLPAIYTLGVWKAYFLGEDRLLIVLLPSLSIVDGKLDPCMKQMMIVLFSWSRQQIERLFHGNSLNVHHRYCPFLEGQLF